jgi:hypothetical protein
MGPLNLKLGVDMLARHLGVTLADLSEVADPVGRIDYLASKVIEQGVRALAPEVQMTYHVARPLIDGLLAKHLGAVSVRVPEEVKKLVLDTIMRRQEEQQQGGQPWPESPVPYDGIREAI